MIPNFRRHIPRLIAAQPHPSKPHVSQRGAGRLNCRHSAQDSPSFGHDYVIQARGRTLRKIWPIASCPAASSRSIHPTIATPRLAWPRPARSQQGAGRGAAHQPSARHKPSHPAASRRTPRTSPCSGKKLYRPLLATQRHEDRFGNTAPIPMIRIPAWAVTLRRSLTRSLARSSHCTMNAWLGSGPSSPRTCLSRLFSKPCRTTSQWSDSTRHRTLGVSHGVHQSASSPWPYENHAACPCTIMT